MITIRLEMAEQVAEVLLALRRDAAQNRITAWNVRNMREVNEAGLARALRLEGTAAGQDAIADAIWEQLTEEERCEVGPTTP